MGVILLFFHIPHCPCQQCQNSYSTCCLVSSPDCHVLPTRKTVWPFSKDFLIVLSQHVLKWVSKLEHLLENNHVTSRQTQRPTIPVRAWNRYQYFMCTAQSFDSSALGIVDVQVRECSSVVQEYSSVQALLFLDSLIRMTRMLFTE